jgi:hypothetical protein
MTDAEISGIAQGMFMYLKDQCPEPCDALGVIATLAVTFQVEATENFPMEEFAEKFKQHMIHLYNNRKPITPGNETIQ